MKKRILVIGNGYDLAHNLKTSYDHFLNYVKNESYIQKTSLEPIEEEFATLVRNNSFINYFKTLTSNISNWSGFEIELKRITAIIVEFFFNMPQCVGPRREREFLLETISSMQKNILESLGFIRAGVEHAHTFVVEPKFYLPEYGINLEAIKQYLREQLEGLNNALEIYLAYFMPQESVDAIEKIAFLDDIHPDYIISFNYTDTYINYGVSHDDVQHIHGELDKHNIVLGFDDDNPDDLSLIFFKKYFQRIQKHIGSLNIDRFYSDDHGVLYKADCHVYGLSLDYTDKELIKEIYENSDRLYFYYRNPSEYEKKIVNLIAILGKEQFLNDLKNSKIIFVNTDTLSNCDSDS